jgi:ATPase subunit of ABC transporter with duplicated ATPase domains
MKILALEIENFKRLKAVEITPDGNTVIISGRNAQGKSSVLDAIWTALAGRSGSVDRPIRDGEDEAHVTVTLDNIIVTRSWTRDKTSLVVKSHEGAKFPSPQALLDQLIGKLSFDPLLFANADAKTQVKMLLDLVQLPFDPEALASQRQQAYDSRTDLGRRLKQVQGAAADIKVPTGTPDEPIDVVLLSGELQAAEQAKHRRETLLLAHSACKGRIADLEAQLAAERENLEHIKAQGSALPAAVDTADLVARMATANEVNVSVRAKQHKAELKGIARELETSIAACAQEIADVDSRKAAGLAAAEFPIEGLGFDEDGVTYNGVPFTQASGAERLRVSVAMAMAMNPELRVIRISDGSLMDSTNMAMLDSMAVDKDFQVWVERVEDGDGVGVVIEDGSVKQ